MKAIFEVWKRGWEYVLMDNLNSFYTCFTVVFAECVYIWSYYSLQLAIAFTIILLGYVLNIVVFAWLKGDWEGTPVDSIVSICYVLILF